MPTTTMSMLRDSACPDCRQLSSGDCGRHGPRIFDAAAFMAAETPSVLNRCNRCGRHWFWNGERHEERDGRSRAYVINVDDKECPVCRHAAQRRLDVEYDAWVAAGKPQ